MATTPATYFGFTLVGLALNLLFSLIGMAFVIYGKRQRASAYRWCGWGLMLFPYFIHGTLPLLIMGVLLTALPYVLPYFME